jgi:hypothetical protein
MLVVFRVNLRQLEKAVFFGTEVNEGGLEARLNIDHHSFVDIAPRVFAGGSLNVELFQLLTRDNGQAIFLRLLMLTSLAQITINFPSQICEGLKWRIR